MNAITRLQTSAAMARIGAHMLWERMTDPHPKRRGEIPVSVDVITQEWLTDVLCRETPGAAVENFTFGGENIGTTSRRAITITYNAAGEAARLPRHVFGKATPAFGSRLLCGLSSAIEFEVQFYNRVRPLLHAETLNCYYAAFDPGSFRSIFLFEDIAATRNTEFLNGHHAFTKDEAEGMIDVMAAYHARFWDSPLLTKEFTWLRDGLANQNYINRLIAFKERTAVGIDRSLAILPEGIRSRAAELWPAMMRACVLRVSGPQTLVHADTHAGNWYKTGDGAMGICDWQCTVTGAGVTDVAYALSASLSIENRRAWEHDLLQRYAAKLQALGAAAPDFATIWRGYREQMLHGLFNWFFVAGAGALQPSMHANDLGRISLERMAAAAQDLQTLDLLALDLLAA